MDRLASAPHPQPAFSGSLGRGWFCPGAHRAQRPGRRALFRAAGGRWRLAGDPAGLPHQAPWGRRCQISRGHRPVVIMAAHTDLLHRRNPAGCRRGLVEHPPTQPVPRPATLAAAAGLAAGSLGRSHTAHAAHPTGHLPGSRPHRGAAGAGGARMRRRAQRGGVVIEFAPLFILQALTYTAAEGARAAVKVEPAAYTSVSSYQTAARNVVRTQAEKDLSWMNDAIRSKITSGITVSWSNSGTMEVRVRYVGYGQAPLLPVLKLPGIGAIPNLPDDLVGTATLRPN